MMTKGPTTPKACRYTSTTSWCIVRHNTCVRLLLFFKH